MEMVNLKIDGIDMTVPAGTTILKAAKEINVEIPTLCFLGDFNEVGSCRICVVEVEGMRVLQPSCVTKVAEGMSVKTFSPMVREARKAILELILANHNRECLVCARNLNCELQKLSNELGVGEVTYEKKTNVNHVKDATFSVVRDGSKCILCGRCVNVCEKSQGVGVINFAGRSGETEIATFFNKGLGEVECINCGQCIKYCPTGALRETDDTEKVWEALADPSLHVVVQTAPAVRVALGEEFGLPIGTDVEGKMVTALRKIGFDKVFDTNFTADVTILEEGTELLDRIKNGGKLPMITSCSPGWIKYCEHYYHDFLDNLSSCKSPQQMFGALAKSYYAEKAGIDPKSIYVVSVMPCTAKKYECEREEMNVDGLRDVDAVVTTRELAKMIRQSGEHFVELEDGAYDSMMGAGSGAAVIFGNTGGVMEAALRTVADILTGEDLPKLEYHPVRGLEGIREATINVAGIDVKVAIATGTGNAGKLLDKIKAGEADYHFIEVMACPGGCINGGGQPIIMDKEKTEETKVKRMKALYDIDTNNVIRKSHKNPEVKELYDDYLEKPNSHKAHHLLHTCYRKRECK